MPDPKRSFDGRLPAIWAVLLTVSLLAQTYVQIADEARRMSALVNNLLDMARIQSGDVKLRRHWLPFEARGLPSRPPAISSSRPSCRCSIGCIGDGRSMAAGATC